MADASEPVGIIELESTLADAEQPKELPAGLYEGEVIDVQIGTSQKGNDYFGIQVHIPTSEYPKDFDADNAPDGMTMFYNMVTVPKRGDQRAMFRLKMLYQALGLDLNTTSIDPNEWMGRKVRCRVRMGKPYAGNPARAEIAGLEKAEEEVRATKPARKR